MYLYTVARIAFHYRNKGKKPVWKVLYFFLKSCQKWSWPRHIKNKNNKTIWDKNLTELEKLILLQNTLHATEENVLLQGLQNAVQWRLSPKLEQLPISVWEKLKLQTFYLFPCLDSTNTVCTSSPISDFQKDGCVSALEEVCPSQLGPELGKGLLFHF